MFCRTCGKKIPDNSNFCEQCGTRVLRNVTGNTSPSASVLSSPAPAAPVTAWQPPRTPSPTNPVPPLNGVPPASAPHKPASSNTTKILLIVGAAIAAFVLLIVIIIAVVFIGSKIIGSANDSGDSNDGYTYDAGNADEYYAYPTLDLFGDDYDSQSGDDYVYPDTQRTLCVSCHGSGMCPVCDGTGIYSNYGQSSECSACDGSGVCSICDGSGYN
jgi:hypothetical protein